MPSYEYECSVHGVFEETHSIHTQLEDCPKCKEENLEPQKIKRLISKGNFILSGNCWSKDNYS